MQAKADEPRTWGTRSEAEARAAQLPRPYGSGGVGIELCELHGLNDGISIGGVDLDTCRDPGSGQIEKWATEVIDRFASYTEVSPSGAGVKVIFTYASNDLAMLRDMRLIEPGNGTTRKPGYGRQFKRANGSDHPPAIELYLGNRYFAVTDLRLPSTTDEIRPVPMEGLVWLLREAGPAFVSTVKKAPHANGKDQSRSAIAFARGAALRRQGKSFEEMCDTLRADPATSGWVADKGLAAGGRELQRIWDRATLIEFGLTEDRIASVFADRHRDVLRYCHHTGAWFQWDGAAWRLEETRLAFAWARHVCRQCAIDAHADPATTATVSKAATAAAVERFAQADRAFAVTSENWDRDLFALGTPGGTVNLRTGHLQAARRSEFISKLTAVAPAATPDCPLWLQFLDDATLGDAGLVRFLRQWCGYSLTGDTAEHGLLFIYGRGGNGKSVFLNTVTGILADYCRTAPMGTFTAQWGERHPTDLAMLRAARMVAASETEAGHSWAEVRLKQLTGGDKIAARFMRQDFFEYRPQFKLTIVGNYRPNLNNIDEATRRRFNIVPFVHKPPRPDKRLEQILRTEWPSILRWMIDGCLDWQMNGLIRPAVVNLATDEYFREQDTIRQWIEDCCETTDRPPHVVDSFASLFASWRNYASAQGEDPGSSKSFSQALQRLDYLSIKDENGLRGRGFRGLKVRVWGPARDEPRDRYP
jgi:putative DNA primase/helicase